MARRTKKTSGTRTTQRAPRPEDAENVEDAAGTAAPASGTDTVEPIEDAVIVSDGPADESAKTDATAAMTEAAESADGPGEEALSGDDPITVTPDGEADAGGTVIDGTEGTPDDPPAMSDDVPANAEEAAALDTTPDDVGEGARAGGGEAPDLDLSADPEVPNETVPPAGAGMEDPPNLDDGAGAGSTTSPPKAGERKLDGAGTAAAVVSPAPTVIEKRGPGFVPLVLGGLIAGAIGYAVPAFLLPATDPGPEVAAPVIDPDRLVVLEEEVAALRDAPAPAAPEPAAPVDLSPLEAAQDDLAARLAGLEAQVAGLTAAGDASGASTAGLDGAATAPAPDLSGLREEIASMSEEVAALSESVAALDVDALRDRVDGLAERLDGVDLEALASGLDALQPRVAELEALPDRLAALEGVESRIVALEDRAARDADTVEAARLAAARERLSIAVASGLPYAEPLALLPDPPSELEAFAETGVATAQELAAEFPPLAREALRAVRTDATIGDGFGALAGRFLGARSIAPREGDDPDAVLSRAEAAVRAGNVDAALEEIDALPEEAREPLAGWASRAEARRLVEAALNDYLQDG